MISKHSFKDFGKMISLINLLNDEIITKRQRQVPIQHFRYIIKLSISTEYEQ